MTIMEALACDARSANVYFQSWAGGIQQALLAFGWVKSSDTGQTDFTTANLAGQLNKNAVNYAIFEMQDSLQSTAPLYLKFQPFGVDSCPAIAWTIGTATDGAGNITGNNKFNFNQTLGQDGSYGGNYSNCYFSGATNRFLMTMYCDPNHLNFQSFFCIERTHDSSGNDTSDGFCIVAASTNCENFTSPNGVTQYFVSGNSSQTPYGQSFVSGAKPYSSPNYPNLTLLQGSNIGLMSVIPFDPSPKNPMLNLLIAGRNDYSPYTTIVVPMYGANHTYFIPYLNAFNWVPGMPYQTNSQNANNGDGTLVFRYE